MSAADWRPEEGAELIGTRAPEWQDIEWVQGGPLSLQGLRGKVVLLRWWLWDCIHCTRSAPALNELREKYHERGLVVVGLHHPKGEVPSDRRLVRRGIAEKGFGFPVGMDNRLTTLAAYGYGSRFKRFSSISFVIDRTGQIRFVHDGGEYHHSSEQEHQRCDLALQALERAVLEALSE